MKRAVRIGVTGKLGSGKSTLMRALEEQGIRALNTDQMAKDIMVQNATIRTAIEQLAGKDVYLDGELDRKVLASKVFKDADLRNKLEAIVHPAVTEAVENEFASAPAESIVAVESALILASEFKRIFDYIILVNAPTEAIIDRVNQYSLISEDDARRRLKVQDYEHANYDDVDITIENSGSADDFLERGRTLALMLKTLAQREMPEEPLHSDQAEA